ncbi:sulfite exporter TauE/SafE family protein [Candidatus Saccharibacteria bacterium]|nr:sulfite exporter TauE/SafE family protein [Candidatus Saccharibacteria bacterium]
MSDIVCVATILLAGLAQASLQLGLGGLILLYHNSLGRHRRRRTSYLARNYILGTGAITFLVVAAFCFLIGNFFNGALTTEWLVIALGALGACAIVMWLLYYRRGKGSTELWLPKSITRFIRKKARQTNDGVEAFSLGLLSSFAEMPISIALFFVVANAILNLSSAWQVLGVVAYTLISIIPMVILQFRIQAGRTAVEAQQWRLKNKAFLKIISGSSFLTLALFVAAFWIMK